MNKNSEKKTFKYLGNINKTMKNKVINSLSLLILMSIFYMPSVAAIGHMTNTWLIMGGVFLIIIIGVVFWFLLENTKKKII